MRKTFLCLALLALVLPVAALAALDAGEGTLSVEDGRGKINLQARGGVFGRLDRGTLTVYDTTPGDANFPVVTGADEPELFLADGGVRYRGAGIRFRVVGGGFRLPIQGRGIDLSVVGKGYGVHRGRHARAGRLLARRRRLPQESRQLQAAPRAGDPLQARRRTGAAREGTGVP